MRVSLRIPRAQIVMDLRLCAAGQTVTMLNAPKFLNNEDYEFTDRVMRFTVISAVGVGVNNLGQPALHKATDIATVPYTDVAHRTAAQLGVTACLMGPHDSFIRRQARVHHRISVSFHSL